MHISADEALLAVSALTAGYGKIGVLQNVNLKVRGGEIVTLLGPNGAGKTTLLRAISGLLPWSGGEVHFDGQNLRRARPQATVQRGLAHVIEGHRIFTQLSVIDNLLLAGYHLRRSERQLRVSKALAYFPEIAAKRDDRGGLLSGGQQQMLSVAQGLVHQPRLLMLDEPSAGLSPVLVERILTVIAELRKETGMAVLLVEQSVEKALAVADRVYAMARGRIVLEASTSEPELPARLERAYFGEAASHDHH